VEQQQQQQGRMPAPPLFEQTTAQVNVWLAGWLGWWVCGWLCERVCVWKVHLLLLFLSSL